MASLLFEGERMNQNINDIVNRIKALEAELERELDRTGSQWRYRLIDKKVRFDQSVLKFQRQFKVNLIKYILTARPRHLLIIPFIYAVFPALVLLDLLASLYHAICFPLLGIPKVHRSDYVVFDRHHLAYLNLVEKVNCAYCSYGNGLLAYLTEIVARTEQYWCPIKHARRNLGAHKRHQYFLDYGDAERYRQELDRVREFKD
jgi:hypothetical protein